MPQESGTSCARWHYSKEPIKSRPASVKTAVRQSNQDITHQPPNGRCWLASTHDAALLTQRWPSQPQVKITETEWDEWKAQVKAAFAHIPRPTHEQIRQAMAEQAARVAVLRAALNMN